MNWNAPFDQDDLEHLDRVLFSLADRVVPMRDIAMGDTNPRTIGLRHDVDDNEGSFYTALELARWEFDRGYSSTFFLLHGSHYWDAEHLVAALEFQELGHEVGLHNNALAEGLRQRRSPDWILREALGDLRSVGLRVEGTVAHGDPLCRDQHREVVFVNDELFGECERPSLGMPYREIRGAKTIIVLEPKPLSDYYLRYDANWLPRADYLSESGGRWSQPVVDVVDRFGEGQLHMLMHPDWWGAAFPKVTV